MIASDNNKELVKAIKRHFQGTTWQRCQTHFSKNVLDKSPKKHQPKLKKYLRSIYQAKDITEARRLLSETLDAFESLAPKAMLTIEKGFEDVMAVMNLPEKYRKRLRTTNSFERLNQEIRRRDRVIRIYPNGICNQTSCSVLIEQDEKWTSRKYHDMDEYYQFINNQQTANNPSAA